VIDAQTPDHLQPEPRLIYVLTKMALHVLQASDVGLQTEEGQKDERTAGKDQGASDG
jgi:hypothetical protein